MGVDLGGDLAGDDLEDLGAELDEQAVERELNLLVGRAALGLGVGDGLVDQGGVLGLLGGGEDERGVGRRILRLVLADGWGAGQRCCSRAGSSERWRGEFLDNLQAKSPGEAVSRGSLASPEGSGVTYQSR